MAGTGAGVSHVLWHPCQEAQGLLVSPRPSLWALPKVLDWQQWVAAAFPSKAVPRGDSIPWLELASLTSLGFGSILGCPQSNQICFIYELFAFLKKDTCPEIEQRVLGWLWGLVRGPERHIYCMMLSLGPAQKHGTSRALDLRFSPSLSQPVPWASFCTPPCLGFLISKVGRQCPPGSVFEG